jgi:glycosyltransferase A (GT-A) superfamily protein (DUF2064 family)
MQNSKAIILFLKPVAIDRTRFDGSFAGLPWTEIDALYSAMFDDTVESLTQIPHTDIIIFHDKTEWSEEFINVFVKSVKVGEVQGKDFSEQVDHALEQISSSGYKKVILFFDSHPLINRDMVLHVFELLSQEDECAVLGQLQNGNVHFLGLRYEITDLFNQDIGETNLTTTAVLRRLCKKETMVFQIDTLYSLDSSESLLRLYKELQDLEFLHKELPKRTHTLFRNLDKKYRLMKAQS